MENMKQIGESTYVFSHVIPEELIKVQVGVARVIGEPLFKAFMATKTSEEEQAAAGAAAIGLMMSKLSAEEITGMMRVMFKYAGKTPNGDTKGKTTLDINTDFQGRPKEMWQVFLASLTYNLGDFIPAALSNSIGALTQKLQG